MADLMKKLKTGKLSALSQQTIQPFEDYEVTDVAEGGITNAQMTLALDESAGSFFKIGSVYLCIDEGTYTKHCFYKWNGVDASTPWEVVGSFANKQDKLTAGENITINENNVISASGGAKYKHFVTCHTGSTNNRFVFVIENASSTTFTADTLKNYFVDNNFTTQTNAYPITSVNWAAQSGTKLRSAIGIFANAQSLNNLTIVHKDVSFTTDGVNVTISDYSIGSLELVTFDSDNVIGA